VVFTPRNRQLAFAETHVASAHTVDAQHFDARVVTTKNLNLGLGDPKGLGHELLERLVGSAVHRGSCECDLEGAFLNPDNPIAAGTRSHTHLEGDCPVLLSNA